MTAITITRNPNNIGSKVYASSWQHVTVVFNGTLLKPEDFYECKGTRWGLQPDGYVNFVARRDGRAQLIQDLSKQAVADVKIAQKRGHVAIIQHSMNTCGFCQDTMRINAVSYTHLTLPTNREV